MFYIELHSAITKRLILLPTAYLSRADAEAAAKIYLAQYGPEYRAVIIEMSLEDLIVDRQTVSLN